MGPKLKRMPTPGDRIGRYEVLARLAAGGMAVVYVVRLCGAGGFTKLLALKVLKPELAEDPYFVEMFLDECRILSQLSHRNVVQVFDVVDDDGIPGMVMEFLRGRSLSAVAQSLSRAGEVVPDAVAASVLAQAADGLHAAHTLVDDNGPMNLVHRDVSPDNIQVCHDGAAKVMDFGIASTRARATKTRHGEFKGKVAYAAPERVSMPQDVDARADVWSLAVVAWELFAGRRLFDADGEAGTLWAVIHAPIPSLAEVRPDLPAPIVDAVMAGLQRALRDRPSDLGGFARAMHSLAQNAQAELARLVTAQFSLEQEHESLLVTIAREAEARQSEVVLPPPAPRTNRRRLGWALAGVAGLAAAGATTAMVRSQPPVTAGAPPAVDMPASGSALAVQHPDEEVAGPRGDAPPQARTTEDIDPIAGDPSPSLAGEVPSEAVAPLPVKSRRSKRRTKRGSRAKPKAKPKTPASPASVFKNPYDKPK